MRLSEKSLGGSIEPFGRRLCRRKLAGAAVEAPTEFRRGAAVMLRFVVRRVLLVLPVLFGLLVLTFILVRVVPNDPSAALAGQNATPQQIAEIRVKYGFDRPLVVQFLVYLRQVAQGDLGTSIQS